MAKEFETIIGLEIHVQLKTKSKMFCRCDNYSVDAKPNTNVCPICIGMPGTLPVANKKAIEWTILTGLALNCKINEFSKFDRKNYFYPDLPKGYQISQYDKPFCGKGSLEIEIIDEKESYRKKIGITRIHLEEDAGKLVHPEGANYSLVDLNRAGTPLMEIVTEPDVRSPKEARIFMQDLRAILRYLEVSDANMEQGNLRCDANISLREITNKTRIDKHKSDTNKLGKKVEIKNMNSFKMVERALRYEEERQRDLLNENKKIVQETRGWNDGRGITVSQRGKEEAHDYRYFPEPDIPPVTVNSEQITENSIDIEKIKAKLPELPTERQKRFEKEYGLSPYDAGILTQDKELADYFEKTLENIPQITEGAERERKIAKKISNWITAELLGLLNAKQININECKIKPQDLAELVTLIDKEEITGKIAKEIFPKMFEEEKKVSDIIKEQGIKQISGEEELSTIINKVIKDNPKSVSDYKKGRVQAIGFLVGQVMRETKGQANPKVVNEILRRKLS